MKIYIKRSLLWCVGLLFKIQVFAQPALTRVEYYVDVDPGYGNGIEVNITPGNNLVNQLIHLDPSSFGEGVHLLVIRALDATGAWSLANKWLILKPSGYGKATGTFPDITRVEYFIDNDPGYGNGKLINFTGGGSPADVTLDFNPAELTYGSHLFVIRARDTSGAWSLVNKWQFFNTAPMPVKFTFFTGTYINEATYLKWETAQEQNSSHFNIQRSANGINFTTIGKVNAAGNTNNITNYSFTDVDAVKAGSDILYYRLELVDIDGKTDYSKIVKINIVSEQNQRIVISPNPVNDKLTIQLNGVYGNSSASLFIMDMAGRKLITKTISSYANTDRILVSVESLPKGLYSVVIVGAESRWQGKFVKE